MAQADVDLTNINYNGTTLFAEWQAVIGPGFNHFVWTIFDLDGPWSFKQQTTSTRIEWPIALRGGADFTYQMYVTMYSDGVEGPTSEPEFVLTERPTLRSVVYSLAAGAGTLVLDWPALRQTGVGGYRATLDSGTSHADYSSNTNAITIEHTFPAPAPTWQASVAGVSISGISSGPQSEPIPVLHRAPAKFNLNYYENGQETNLEARWEKLAQECAYRLIVTRDDVQGNPVDTTSARLELGSDNGNSGQRITATIRAVKGVSSGPSSDPVPAPFVVTSVFVYDDLGRLLQVDAGTQQKTVFKFDERGNITHRSDQ